MERLSLFSNFCLIFQVGPASCGKTSLVSILSSLTSHPLRVLSMNSEMDTTELLGGFEQVGQFTPISVCVLYPSFQRVIFS